MKKILIATDSFLPRWDGIARFLSEIIPRLDTEYQVKVIAPDFPGHYDEELLTEVVRIPLSRIKIADYQVPKPSFSQIRTHVRESDIVWTQTIGPIGAMAILAARKEKKKVAAYIHSIEWELFPRSLKSAHVVKWAVHQSSFLITKHLYNRCDLLIVPSEGVGDMLTRKGITTPKKVVHLGVNTKTFRPPESKEKAKHDIGISPNRLVVGFAGRIGHEKDIMTLYRAFGRIHRKHNALLLIVGQDLGGITKTIEKSPKVRIIGSTNDIAPYIQSMDIYVLPSLTETSSLSTIEAMSCETAVLTTPVGSVREYIKEGVNGLFFEKKNTFELAQKIDLLLSDGALRRRLGQAARRTIIDRFSWEKTVSEMKTLLEELNKQA